MMRGGRWAGGSWRHRPCLFKQPVCGVDIQYDFFGLDPHEDVCAHGKGQQ
jgi:hypothetical protein